MSKPFYLTTSIAYANAGPHLGFALESVWADAIARAARQRGRETHFVTGTDEHGQKIARAAELAGVSPQAFVDANSAQFQSLRAALDLSWDDFIRTTDRTRHHPAAAKLWQVLAESGYLEKRSYTGLYCAGCEEFKRPADLTEGGLCPNHQVAPTEVAEENWFFRLSAFTGQIAELFESGRVQIVPANRATEFRQLLAEGLHDVSFSRPCSSCDWGVPVPGDDSQVMYVWCDALTNYISALGYGSANDAPFQKFWTDGAVTHAIGKDIVRFHAGVWLGMLLAAELPLPAKIWVHGFVTSEGQKMSKSLGNVVDPVAAAAEWGVDALRYYLLSEIPAGQDGDFSAARFAEKYGAELANGLGNLLSRATTLARKNALDGVFTVTALDENAAVATQKMWTELEAALGNYDLKNALAAVWGLVDFANKYVDDTKPWTLKTPAVAAELSRVLGTLLEILRQLALALAPFLPQTAEKMAAALGVPLGGSLTELQKWGGAPSFPLGESVMLFPRRDA